MKKFSTIKKFYIDHERTILLTTLAVVTAFAALEQSGIRQYNKFLVEKNLFDEYYFVE